MTRQEKIGWGLAFIVASVISGGGGYFLGDRSDPDPVEGRGCIPIGDEGATAVHLLDSAERDGDEYNFFDTSDVEIKDTEESAEELAICTDESTAERFIKEKNEQGPPFLIDR